MVIIASALEGFCALGQLKSDFGANNSSGVTRKTLSPGIVGNRQEQIKSG
jgi:hypothetical protein